MPLENLAALVQGGLPQETVTLLAGSPGTGKSTMTLQLLHDHVARGGQALLITTEASPTQIFHRSDLLHIPLQGLAGDGLTFLDAYSWRAGKPSPERSVVAVSALGDLSGLSIKLTETLDAMRARGRPILVVFDTPSTLTLHAPGTSILKFLEIAFAKVKAIGGSLLVPVEKDMHDEAFTATLAAMCDGVLTFRLVEQEDDLVRQMRVSSMRTAPASSAKWVKLRLTPSGLDVEGPIPKAAG